MSLFGFFKRKKKEKKVDFVAGTATTAELKKSYGKKKRKVNGAKTCRTSSTKPNVCKRTGYYRGLSAEEHARNEFDPVDAVIAAEVFEELLGVDDDDAGYSGMSGSSGYESDSGGYDGGSDGGDSDD